MTLAVMLKLDFLEEFFLILHEISKTYFYGCSMEHTFCLFVCLWSWELNSGLQGLEHVRHVLCH